MDVLILSASYGAGHNSVSTAVKEAVNEASPSVSAEVRDYFDIVSPSLNNLVRMTYVQSVRRAPALWNSFYQATDNIKPNSAIARSLNRVGRRELVNFAAYHRPQVIVCTYPTPAGVLSELRAEGRFIAPCVTIITDYVVHNQWIHPHVDLYLAPSERVASGLVERGVKSDRIVVSGLPVKPRFARKNDKGEMRERFGLSADSPVVLFITGALPMLAGVPEAVEACLSTGTDMQLVVVCGHSEKIRSELQKRWGDDPRLRLFGFVEYVDQLMDASDLLLTKAGGITVSEALVKQIPMAIYRPIPGQELSNTNYLCEHGAARAIMSDEELAAELPSLLDPAWLAAASEAAGKLRRPDAAADAARHVLGMLADEPVTLIV